MPVTNYIWDVVSDNVLMEVDDDGNTLARYVHEPDLYGEAISQERDGQTRYYNYDGLGNTVELTDENENVTDTYEYTAFGEEVARTGTTENPFRYKGALGYYTNGETDDIYVRARPYEPTVGRWVSRDPLGVINGYVFVENRPTVGDDPSGLQPLIKPTGVVISAVNPWCKGCGHAAVDWDIRPSVANTLWFAQRLCWFVSEVFCSDAFDSCGCDHSPRKITACCVYEYLGRKDAIGNDSNDKWELPESRGTFPHLPSDTCQSFGFSLQFAEVRGFRTEDEINVGLKNPDLSFTCPGMSRRSWKIGPHRIQKPDNWDNAVAIGFDILATYWDCCPEPGGEFESWFFYKATGTPAVLSDC